jgi:HD-like signal output (HDOD) protein
VIKRLLFVDDERSVLDGYRRNLRSKEREGWVIAYAESGEQALQLLDAAPYDVVISDMRMPGMNGAELLNEVMIRQPRTIRIVLSGYADREMIRQCLGSAHQFLAKPFDLKELFETIEEVGEAGRNVEAVWLNNLVEMLEFIPALPTTYHRLREVLENDESSMTRIADIIAEDPGMTTQVLRLVNSPFFGLRRVIGSPMEAVAYLGVDQLKALSLAYGLFHQFDPARLSWFKLERLVAHSQQVAFGARAIARLEGAPKAIQDEAFSAGLLHDIGILVLVSNFPEPYREIYTAAEKQGSGLREGERNGFRAAHPGIAGHLLSFWGIPPRIVEAVTFHHDPSLTEGGSFSPLAAVHIADAFAAWGPEGSHLDEDYLVRVAHRNTEEEWRQAFREAFQQGPSTRT